MNKTHRKRAKRGGAHREKPLPIIKALTFFKTRDLDFWDEMQAFRAENLDCSGWLEEHCSLQGEMHLVMNYGGL